jgi:hypothetical protein
VGTHNDEITPTGLSTISIQITPFSPDLLPQAGALLAARHQRDCAALSLLPARFSDAAVAQKAIAAALQRTHASGFAALAGDSLVAYLIGDLQINEVWGRSGWVRTPGVAYEPGGDVEIVRELYAALGEQWVADGVFCHFVLLPLSDPALLQAWFRLSFGIEQIHALLDLATIGPVKVARRISKSARPDRQIASASPPSPM